MEQVHLEGHEPTRAHQVFCRRIYWLCNVVGFTAVDKELACNPMAALQSHLLPLCIYQKRPDSFS